MRRYLSEYVTAADGFSESGKIKVLKVAETSVKNFEAIARCSRSKILPFYKCEFVALAGKQRKSRCTMNPPAHNDGIKISVIER